jgi:hypothetical protein
VVQSFNDALQQTRATLLQRAQRIHKRQTGREDTQDEALHSLAKHCVRQLFKRGLLTEDAALSDETILRRALAKQRLTALEEASLYFLMKLTPSTKKRALRELTAKKRAAATLADALCWFVSPTPLTGYPWLKELFNVREEKDYNPWGLDTLSVSTIGDSLHLVQLATIIDCIGKSTDGDLESARQWGRTILLALVPTRVADLDHSEQLHSYDAWYVDRSWAWSMVRPFVETVSLDSALYLLRYLPIYMGWAVAARKRFGQSQHIVALPSPKIRHCPACRAELDPIPGYPPPMERLRKPAPLEGWQCSSCKQQWIMPRERWDKLELRNRLEQ